jgi:hypothetical protein
MRKQQENQLFVPTPDRGAIAGIEFVSGGIIIKYVPIVQDDTDSRSSSLELISQDRVQWNGITCRLSEQQRIVLEAILYSGYSDFASLGELIYGDDRSDPECFYSIAKEIRRKFKASSIPFTVFCRNQKLFIEAKSW